MSIDMMRPPKAAVECRAAETVGVRYPDRIIEVRAMPYEVETTKVVRNGKQITEVVSRGAFGRCEDRKDVRAYRSHDKSTPVGRAVALHPARDDGLVAEVKISKTGLGDETLELAADGLLDASVGFAPMKERWSPSREHRRLERVYLDHIALLPDPAYEGANVLDVRREADEPELLVVPTPNKDRIIAIIAELSYRREH
jgi:HK97 family phage prohead protease